VIEWDEKHHLYSKQILKDKQRSQDIILHTNCTFYRINEEKMEIVKIDKDGKEEKYKENHWFYTSDL